MADKNFPKSGLPIRRSVELLPTVFQTDTNDKFLSGVLDPLVQPGVLDKVVGYAGRRYGKTYNGNDVYIDSDQTLRSRYQLEPGVIYRNADKIENFYDYIDFKNQLKFFGNLDERDDKITSQEHYSWNPPIKWDKFVNYREYYWEPSGPPPITVLGQSASVTSTYKVRIGDTKNSFIFTPDAFTNNPTVTLYRGQTYKFKIDAPGEGFIIRTNYDTGSLIYRPFQAYAPGQLAVSDGQLWKAKVAVSPADGSSITIDSQDWELIGPTSNGTGLDYNKGVTNNGIETGTLTFTVPYDAPDILFYQGLITPDALGRFLIADIESNSFINIDKDIIGKSTYRSSNGVEFTNGLVVEFQGNVTPSEYSQNTWLVEGVGSAITLTKFADLIVPVLTTDVPEVLFDNEGFDTQPFDDAAAYPTYKDYITISRDSQDNNPWSRYNRWFHRSVLEYAYRSRGQDYPATEASRAIRPIIEFNSNLQLFNHGAISKQTVDYIDTFTTDIFSVIEGSAGYNIDGEFLFEGARVLFVADKDTLVNNKIYQAQFITHNNVRQLHLVEAPDSDSFAGEGVLIRRGVVNRGLMYHYNGTSWVLSQRKTAVNQPPQFDVFDTAGVSFSNTETYPVSTFTGCKLVSYKLGNGPVDKELGFSISYLNIDNVGDIQFEWNWDSEKFFYTTDQILQSKNISEGYYKFNPEDQYDNGWLKTSNDFIQPLIDSVIVFNTTNQITLNTIDWSSVTDNDLDIVFYLNGNILNSNYTRNLGTFTFEKEFAPKDAITIKLIAPAQPDQGYYEIPVGLEKNPLNDKLNTFTLGQAIDHVRTALEFNKEIVGSVLGPSNLRDISGYQSHAKRFLKHSGSSLLAISLLCDKTHNIIKSLQYSKKAYTDFKNNFLLRAVEIDFNDSVIDFVDDIIADLTKTKTSNSPFADSDMIGNGAFTAIKYSVEDTGIKTFSLTEQFSLTELSRRAVYVYLNGQQLLNSTDYQFDPTFGFVRLLIDLAIGDLIEIREYVSTAYNHIPVTPTAIGLYKKYTPTKFIDDTYVEPREVIQGHDGSITFAYGDFRDDLLLELEYRIYNNIKQEYDPSIFDIDAIVGGYNGVGLYNKSQLDSIVIQEFLKWIQNTNINYTLNTYLDTENSFTYTYSNMTDPTGTQNLPGYWRGVYKWFYDTDRPHRCPWEMLGFSQMPAWWESEYGPAPYTRNNLILWEDLRDGIIRQGTRAGQYDRYKRPTILSHIPVDGDGKLLSPLDSGLARDFSLINNKGPFVLGDISPVEYSWRASSEWPFAVVIAMCLMKPFEFITDNFDLSKTKLNNLGQTVNTDTNLFPTLADLIVPQSANSLSSGLVKYLVSYTRSRGVDVNTLQDKILNLDVALTARLSGFVDQRQQKYLLDSKNPNATSSSIFVPPENYDIIFNVSVPISSVAYSGVILEKTDGGWIVSGYDDIQPYFNYYSAVPNQRDPLISVGGVSESFLDWTENRLYSNGTLIRNSNNFYRAIRTHNSGGAFDETQWKKLAGVPKVGAVEAFRRKNFNTISVKKLSYGTKLTDIQQVVDFLLGYEQYLISVGFTFDRYDPENQVSQDWLSSSKEFMFWTKHNWAIGSLITISPGASKLDITVPVGVADSILDGFYDYQILKGDGQPLPPQFINVNRSFQRITVETVNTTEGLFYLKLYYVLKEHVTVFSDRTVFNDVIYDKPTGYRQERIKTQGFRTVDWDGDYTSPGFLFDNVNIAVWKPFTDYRLGDIVAYKSYNWTSLQNQLGTEIFDDSKWSKLDVTPEKQLIANFDYKIKEFSDFFEVSSEGIGASQRELARHVIGYQTREYLQNLSEDPVTQFQLYQGFIREKGTANAITKVFGKLSRSGADSIILDEEWAFRVGRLGGVDQLTEVELRLVKNEFNLNPQPVLIENSVPAITTDRYYRLTNEDFTVSLIPFSTNINSVSTEIEITSTAGYVALNQIEHTVGTIDDILNLDIATVNENDHIWVTFNNFNWTVMRFNESSLLTVDALERTSDTAVILTLGRYHNLLVNDIVGIRDIINLSGFFKIIETTKFTITIEISADLLDPEIDSSTVVNIHLLTPARVNNYTDLDPQHAALLKDNSKIFVDNNGNNHWEVVEKKKQYSTKNVLEYGIASPQSVGTKVIYDNNLKHTITSMPGSGYVTVYVENSSGLQLKQIISPPTNYLSRVIGTFGESLAVSSDSRFLIVGSPLASDLPSEFKGLWDSTKAYGIGEIVLYAGQLYRAISSNSPDGSSTIAINSDDWEIATNVKTYSSASGTGFYEQGMITVYEYISGRYQLSESFVSPRPADNEKFGSEICISVDGTTYYLAISAVGSYNNTGRVYLYKFDGSEWNHLENPKYKGIYNPLETYRRGDIVWQGVQDPTADGVRGILWQALGDVFVDGSTITIDSEQWLKVSDISTHNSLPTNISVEDDGSTLEFAYTGLLSDMQLAEVVKQGDMFGFSMAMNKSGSILVVGAPNSDGQYFANYRGIWRPDVEYVETEVVKKENAISPGSYIYYRLEDTVLGVDSTLRSYNEDPSSSSNWVEISDSTVDPSGKIFVYQRTTGGAYELKQMINAGSLPSFNDLESGLTVDTGDQFGFAMDIDATGTTLVVSSPKADINFQNQGTVYVFTKDSSAELEYRLTQKLESFEMYPNEYFGYSVSISPDTAKIVIGARNTPTKLPIYFDSFAGTTFDYRETSFYRDQGFTGNVYVFDKKDQIYFLTEKLQTVLSPNESFGHSVDCVGNIVVVGSPKYTSADQLSVLGTIRLFKRDSEVKSWTTLAEQQAVIDLRLIRSIELYDDINNIKIQDIDYVDAAKGKILNIADREIKFKSPFDPAIYSVGTDEQIVDPDISWLEKNVGKLWWDVSTVKWLYAEQGDIAYRIGNWNQLATGSSVDVYEWVKTPLLPSEWAAVADTNEGTALGISGQPLYPNDDVYSIKQFFSESTGQVNETNYYYWVRNKSTIPSNTPSRSRSAAEVASLISNPANSGIAFISLIDTNKFLTYNFDSVLSSDTALLNIQYRKNLQSLKPIHNEYQLLTEGVADSLPTPSLENKWIDSLVGNDKSGNRVPDTKLSAKQKYGVQYRPRQSMFVNRLPILKTVVENVNTILRKEAFADTIDFSNLNLVDSIPDAVLNLYDVTVDTFIDLSAVGTVRTKQAILQANIVDGELDTVDIIDPGFGYRVTPSVEIEGDGNGAKAELTLDNQGRVSSVTVVARGKKYSSIIAKVRNFAVLVVNDSTIGGFWSIYGWDNIRQVFFRSQSQAFDTTKYWSYVDWWDNGYGITSRIVKEVLTIVDGFDYELLTGDLLRIKEFSNGGWAVFEKLENIEGTFVDQYRLVGRQRGTVELSQSLYDTTIFGIGFDNTQSFDNALYDIENSKELRNILIAIKENIFIGEYAVEWNKLFFTCIRYVFDEQQYVDWAFKTSFLNATHNVGSFEQKLNYKNDNLENYQDYINEVKPYRTTVREYVSRYNTVEPVGSAVTDFDLPATYSEVDGSVVPVKLGSSQLDEYPWKWWADNNGYSIVDIQLYDSGEQYTQIPKVLIEGNGTGATAQAYVSNGRVSGIQVLTPGAGYTQTPTVTLVGGNPAGVNSAKAVAILGDSKARMFDLSVKFDRINKDGLYQSFNQEQTFIATGFTSVFDLNYPPTRDKSKISLFKNNQVILNNEYSISLYYSSTDTYKLLRGRIIFSEPPASGDIISIVYEKNIELLDAVNRIQKYYSPTAGMKGSDLGQLMTGVDFGGVQIQGTTFEVTGGWDALPWFTDNWDSVESSSDYYVIADGSTISVTLPFVPADGQQITVYIKRVGESTPTRIDDPNYTDVWDSSYVTNPSAQMPTFIGDGSTSVVEIGVYLSTNAGDTLIFRPIESDGSVTITDPNLLDTRISGGTLSAIDQIYATATGASSDEIAINGGKFIEPDHVPAPEENVPGQVLDSVSIRVFHNSISGVAPLQSKIQIGNGTTSTYSIGQTVVETNSVLVYVNKVKKQLGIDYTIDLSNYTISFTVPPIDTGIIEILSIGIGGTELIDYQEFVADGDTNLFLTNANYDTTSSVFVTVNGVYVDVGYRNSTDVIDAVGKTLVEFGLRPNNGDIIKIICLRNSNNVNINPLVVSVNQQTFAYDGSTASYALDEFVSLARASAEASVVVEINGRVLQGVDTIYRVYDGITNDFILGVDPNEPAGTILPSNINVFVNDNLQTFIEDYVYNGTTKTLTITSTALTAGDVVKIENNFRSEYSIVGNNIIISADVESTLENNDDSTIKDLITVTWFSEYPSMGIVSDELTGGKVQYQLANVPLSSSYVWVYKNGIRLTQEQDYYISLPRAVIYLTESSEPSDLIKIVLFGSNIFRLPSAFEIHKDMLNFYHFKRFSKGTVKLGKELAYYDTQIEVTDASELTEPIQSRNIPGIVYVNGERIEYMIKQGNILKQLRRGSAGTPIAEIHTINSDVTDVGANETLPYNETQDRIDFVSDGSSLLIGPLDFVPAVSTRNTWYRSSIPNEFGPCDQLEVFAAGRRLRKDPIDVYQENNGASSPAADIKLEAEFSVDGITGYVRLTSVLPAGTRITIITRTGKTWYDRGETTASNGVTLLENNTSIANFIAQKSTSLPE
jgi:hypothetical protein